MKTKLHKKGDAVKLNFEGDLGQVGYVWLSYLEDKGAVMVRVVRVDRGEGEIIVETHNNDLG